MTKDNPYVTRVSAGYIHYHATVTNSDDVYLQDATNFGSNTSLIIGKSAGVNKTRTIIKFNIGSSVPSNATVLNAQMKLRYYGTSGSTWIDRWVQAHRLVVDWTANQANKDARITSPSYTPWNATYGKIGGTVPPADDANGTMESTLLFWSTETLPVWKSWDLTGLTQKWVNGTATNYGVILWATNEDADGKDLRFRSSQYSTDQPYLQVIYSTETTTRTVYFLKDHLGSIRATVLDSATAPVIGYDDYDSWGYPLALRTKAIPNAYLQGASKNKFTGKERDDEYGLNLDYFGARYYDWLTGRWISIDPLWLKHPDVTPYNYVLNNPLLYIDPDGQQVRYNVNYSPPPTPAQIKQNFAQSLERSKEYASAGVYTMAAGTLALGALEAVGSALASLDPFGISSFANPILMAESVVARGATLVDDAAGALSKAANVADDIGEAAAKGLPVLRQHYVNAVTELRSNIPAMREAGMASEQIARALHAERRALGENFKNLTSPDKLQKIYERNLQRYGDRLGPSIEWLREHGKSWEDIIESATRTGGQDLGF